MVSGERLDQTDLSQCAMADLQRVRQSGSVADAALVCVVPQTRDVFSHSDAMIGRNYVRFPRVPAVGRLDLG